MEETHTDAAGFQPAPLSPSIEVVLDLLYDEHGRPQPEGEDDILGTLIATILSQSTNNANSERAFGELLDRFAGDWDQIRQADVAEVADAIQIGGLSRQKAPRIQAILEKLHAERGEYSLEFLREREVDAALAYLLELKGVGPKTASFVLMRAAGAPLFPMDTHILRLCKRLGWIADNTSDRKAHDLMLPHIPEGDHEPAHVVMIWHGRRICHARNPECARCPLLDLCAWGQRHQPAR